MFSNWNPWHGCTKISEGCKYCYVYRQDAMYGAKVSSSEPKLNAEIDLPLRKKRDKNYKIPSGDVVFTCMTSDFFLDAADQWRKKAWEIIKIRKDLIFYIFTKRIHRFEVNLPEDWGNGYDNVVIACTVENQQMADHRLPIFRNLPIKHKAIICAPLISDIDLMPYLDFRIEEISVGGESGIDARICDYNWILNIRNQCISKDIPFRFHQTGAKLLKDNKIYRIKRNFQISQAKKAGIDYHIGADYKPEL